MVAMKYFIIIISMFSFYFLNAQENKTFLYKYKNDNIYIENFIQMEYKDINKYIKTNRDKVLNKELEFVNRQEQTLKTSLIKPFKIKNEQDYLDVIKKKNIQAFICYAFWKEVEKEFCKDVGMDISNYVNKDLFKKYINQVGQCHNEINKALYNIQILKKTPNEVYNNSKLLQKIYENENWYLNDDFCLDLIQWRAMEYRNFSLYNDKTKQINLAYKLFFERLLFFELLEEYIILNKKQYIDGFEDTWGEILLFKFSVKNEEELKEVKNIINKVLSDNDEIAMGGLNKVNQLLYKMKSISTINITRSSKRHMGLFHLLPPEIFKYKEYVKIKTNKNGTKTYVYNFTKKAIPHFKKYIHKIGVRDGFIDSFFLEYSIPEVLKLYYNKVLKNFKVAEGYSIPTLHSFFKEGKEGLELTVGKINFADFRKKSENNHFFEYIVKWY